MRAICDSGASVVGRLRVLVAVFAAIMVVVCLGAVGAAAKPVTIGEPGELAGQVNGPESVGVDLATGSVYVADQRNSRVDEFNANGEFLLAWGIGVLTGAEELQVCTKATGCRKGLTNASHREFLNLHGLVVDQSSEDVWVSDDGGVQEYGPSGELLRSLIEGADAPLAIDGAGDVWIGEGERVQEFSPYGAHMATVALPGLGEARALAVTASGDDVYVTGNGLTGVREYETATGKEVAAGPIDGTGEPEAIALNGDGDLYVGGECHPTSFYQCSGRYSFKEYSPAGVQLGQFGMGQVIGDPGLLLVDGGVDGIAVEDGGASPSLYSASAGQIVGEEDGGASADAVQRFPLPAPGPLPEDESASGVGSTMATLEASLDPENHQTTYQFEYGTEPGVYSHTTSRVTSPSSTFAAETVRAGLAALLPETIYYYRLAATNHCNEANPSEECTIRSPGAQFTTLPAVAMESESVPSVSSNSASFEGVLNPVGVQARWWVEYGTQEDVYEHSTTVEPLGSGSTGVTVGAHVQGLEASTVYHYRFAASDVREGHAYTVYGQTLSFTTQAAALSSSLPDGREWEQVSPEDKQDASFEPPSQEGGVDEAAASGDGISYLATSSIGDSPPGVPSPVFTQLLSMHSPDGWGSRDIASPHEQAFAPVASLHLEFYAFSPDLSEGLVDPEGYTLLGGATERTPYLRSQVSCESEASASKCYLPLVTDQDVTSGEKWGGAPEGSYRELGYEQDWGEVEYVAATPDLSHVLLGSKVPLLAGAIGAGLYEWSAGNLSLVSVLPGTSALPAVGPYVQEGSRRNVISSDGDRVVWAAGQHLYMRETGSGRTVQLDEGSSGQHPAEFQDANNEDSLVFFTDSTQLTADATSGNSNLYVYEANADVDAEPGAVSDVTVPVHAGEDADVVGQIPGVSADGSVVYVVAGGVLSAAGNEHGEMARSGQPNLYRIERVEKAGSVSWVASFIATLSSGDEPDWGAIANLPSMSASVSSSGQWLAFMSDRSLTGYDNEDVSSEHRGERMDEEVFLYDAAGNGGQGSLVCASCDPSGARPHGLQMVSFGEDTPQSLMNGDGNTWNQRWIAGLIPGWNASHLDIGLYQPRYLSDSGRLFFDSADALVPQDVNATADVYEYEPPGVGSCTSESETYSSGQTGCIGLISSGISSEETVFLDASENGNDVFFLTAGKLVPRDTDSAYDVYDAHVCGSGGQGEAEWACAPPAAVSPPCSNTSSCRVAPEPQPSVFGAPPSATFSGTGNLATGTIVAVKSETKPKAKSVKCKKGFVKKKGRCVKYEPKGKARKAAAKRAGESRRGK